MKNGKKSAGCQNKGCLLTRMRKKTIRLSEQGLSSDKDEEKNHPPVRTKAMF
ncbi:hypothetical protein [Bacillus tuaregi]|uniref:hypothetical protein n=1 Tax=Bacillus tuaregi TaxID=1816695 RepID=UPI0013564295|nr:hypothetical protein [Bacillus tuaregi]